MKASARIEEHIVKSDGRSFRLLAVKTAKSGKIASGPIILTRMLFSMTGIAADREA